MAIYHFSEWAIRASLFAAIFALCAHSATAGDQKPADIPLIKLEYPGNPPNIRMLYINILKLGDRRVDQPLLFDTGSSGMTIACEVVLSPKLCSTQGIKISEDLEIGGITVTAREAVMNYGAYDEYGNIARARVTFGSGKLSGTTNATVDFLLRYKKVRRSTGEIVGGPLWPKGIFGVSPIGGGGPDRMLRSPLAHAVFPNGLARGFYLSPIGADWRICTNEQGNCPSVTALHIGIPEALKKNFTVSKMVSANWRYNFPTVLSCIHWGQNGNCKPTMYDTGNSTIMVAGEEPAASGFSLDAGVGVTIMSNGHPNWNFTTDYKPEVEFIPQLEHHIVGIRYFEANSLLFDLDENEIGFRIGD